MLKINVDKVRPGDDMSVASRRSNASGVSGMSKGRHGHPEPPSPTITVISEIEDDTDCRSVRTSKSRARDDSRSVHPSRKPDADVQSSKSRGVCDDSRSAHHSRKPDADVQSSKSRSAQPNADVQSSKSQSRSAHPDSRSAHPAHPSREPDADVQSVSTDHIKGAMHSFGEFLRHSQEIQVSDEMRNQLEKAGYCKLPRDSPIRKETGAFYAVPEGQKPPEHLVEGEYVVIPKSRNHQKITTTKDHVVYSSTMPKKGEIEVEVAGSKVKISWG